MESLKGKRTTHQNLSTSLLPLLLYRTHDALDGRLEEACNVRSERKKEQRIDQTPLSISLPKQSQNNKHESDVPIKLELPEANVTGWVIIPRGAEFDVLRLVGVPESQLRRLVKAAGDVVKVVNEGRIFQECYRVK